MDKCKIVITRSFLPVDKEYLIKGIRERVGDCFELIEPDAYDETGICKVVGDADILLGPFVTEKIIENAKKLKLIQVPWTGMDTFNFEAVNNISIPVCNSHSNADAVAELGVTIVLDLIKKVSYHDSKMRSGNWNRDQQPLNLKSLMLSKQTVCILGYGNIGSKTAKLIKAFGAKVIAVDGFKKADDIVFKVYNPSDWYEAINNADIIICNLPLTDKTKGQVNADAIQVMKQGSYLVNMSRADIIDEDAVFEALNSGKLAGFGSDVWWNAPKRGESKSYASTHNDFEKLPNVILSPHRAGFIEEILPHLDDVIVNITNLIQGRDLICVVDCKKRY